MGICASERAGARAAGARAGARGCNSAPGQPGVRRASGYLVALINQQGIGGKCKGITFKAAGGEAKARALADAWLAAEMKKFEKK